MTDLADHEQAQSAGKTIFKHGLLVHLTGGLIWAASWAVLTIASTAAPENLTQGKLLTLVIIMTVGAVAAWGGGIMALFGLLRWAVSDPILAALKLGQSDGQMVSVLQSINERLLISDAAKRIAYREKDREALRTAIREDMDRGDYDAAMVLVSEMGRSYGYRLEAEQFREEIEAARASDINARITQAVSRLDQVLALHDWDRAAQEAAKIQRLFPESPRVKDLELRVREARQEHKRELEHQFVDAAQREDTDLASELLKELDRYLTPDEAKPYVDTARQVLTKKRNNMGLQFKMAVDDKDWNRAIVVGEQIVEEFPNSKMAEEVRALLPQLKKKTVASGAEESETEEVS